MKKTKLISAMLLAAVLLSACGGAKTVDGTKSGSDAASEQTAEKTSAGGSIDVQIGSSPETMDPALNSAADAANMILHAFTGLLTVDKNQNIVGGLAEKWETSEDGLTWTFHLRPDLKWSDGSDLTAEDFVYSWKRLADPSLAAPYGYDLLNMIEGYDKAANGDLDALAVSAPDSSTFVVKLSNPCTYFDKIAS